MPKGPQGQKRPGDVVGCAVTVAKIATGEITEDVPKNRDIKIKGGKTRVESMTSEERSDLARKAAEARWG